MGPSGKSPEDVRLEALLAHRRAVDGREDPDRSSIIKSLAPLLIAQALDMITTERTLHSPTPPGWMPPKEHNPIPGMGSTGGRMALWGLEAALVAAAMKKKPKVGAAAGNALTAMHTAAARGNQQALDYDMPFVRAGMARR